MALTQGSSITAADINQLKADIKAEVKRRIYYSNISSYGGSSYDYTTAPAAGGTINLEHQTKLAQQMRAVNTSSITVASQGDTATALSSQRTLVTNWKGYSISSSTTGCGSACTGLCSTNCGNSCSSCTGSCVGGCGDGCTNCTGTCSLECQEDGCTGTCNGCTGCSASCKRDCTTGCTGGCKTTCVGTCSLYCQEDG